MVFQAPENYETFISIAAEARTLRPMRIIAYCLMPNHWHFLLWPEKDGDLSKFMHWLTTTHASRWRRESLTRGEGAVYQSRFNAVPVVDLAHLLTVWRYVERNPVEAGLVQRAEEWRWSSAALWNDPSPALPMDTPPIPRPSLEFVNAPEMAAVEGLFVG